MDKVVVVVIIVLLLALVWIGITCYRSTSEDVTITIKSKERVTGRGGDDSYYLVWTHGETLCVKDSLSFTTWNASDTYGQLEIGKTYKVKVAGWRIPFFSMYRNVVEVYGETEK